MEILEEKNGTDDWTLDVKCEIVKDQYGLTRDADKLHCESLLRVNAYDIKAARWEKSLMQLEGVDYIVKCPKCGCEIWIDPDKIPGYIKFKALKEFDDKERKMLLD